MEEKEAIARLIDHFSVHDDGRPTPKLNLANKIYLKNMDIVGAVDYLRGKV